MFGSTDEFILKAPVSLLEAIKPRTNHQPGLTQYSRSVANLRVKVSATTVLVCLFHGLMHSLRRL